MHADALWERSWLAQPTAAEQEQGLAAYRVYTELVQLYDTLLALTGSPVVVINRALAVAEIDGAEAGLAAMQAVAGDGRLADYQPYWSAKAELLARTGDRDEAARAYDIAIGLERDAAVRRFLQRRQAVLTG